jgi:hypothetical protein
LDKLTLMIRWLVRMVPSFFKEVHVVSGCAPTVTLIERFLGFLTNSEAFRDGTPY